MTTCPTCGRSGYDPRPQLPPAAIRSAEDLVAAMNMPGKDRKTRDVYQDRDARGYWITYGHERVVSSAVGDALKRGWIVPTFPHIEYGYWSLPERAAECHREWAEMEQKRAAKARRKAGPNP